MNNGNNSPMSSVNDFNKQIKSDSQCNNNSFLKSLPSLLKNKGLDPIANLNFEGLKLKEDTQTSDQVDHNDLLLIELDGSSLQKWIDFVTEGIAANLGEFTLELTVPLTEHVEQNMRRITEKAKAAFMVLSKAEPVALLIRQLPNNVETMLEIRVACAGNVDAGKSTLLGVLTKSVLDDGRGKARLNLFRHRHEVESGRTSSVGNEIMGLDERGNIVSLASLAQNKSKLTWQDICTHSSKIINFLDLAGHERYLKTTVFGMTGCSPDYVMLIVGANAGIIGMTKEHLGLSMALSVPVFVVVTKVDMCPANVLEATMDQLFKILKSPGCRKVPTVMESANDVVFSSTKLTGQNCICPIFKVSNVTGENLDLLRLFLNILPVNPRFKASGCAPSSQPVEFQITETFSVPGVGTVVSGVLLSGVVRTGDFLLIGPDSAGSFTKTQVKSIQRKKINVTVASAGQSVAVALRKIKRSQIRKGMVLLGHAASSNALPVPVPQAVFEFEAEVLILFHSTTISPKYQAMMHCGCIRQTVRIVKMDKPLLRTKDRAIVTFRFLKHPEFLKAGAKLLFREGRTKGIGTVTKILT